MLLLLALACEPAAIESDIRLCDPGFGLASDGMCYPLADDDTADTGPAVAYVDVDCYSGGSQTHAAAIDVPGTVVAVYGFFDPALAGVCDYYDEEWCALAAAGAYGAPAEVSGATAAGVIVTCEWQTLTGTADGEPREWSGFTLTPIRAYYIPD